MSQAEMTDTGNTDTPLAGMQSVVADWGSDQRAFKNVPWGKGIRQLRFGLPHCCVHGPSQNRGWD